MRCLSVASVTPMLSVVVRRPARTRRPRSAGCPSRSASPSSPATAASGSRRTPCPGRTGRRLFAGMPRAFTVQRADAATTSVGRPCGWLTRARSCALTVTPADRDERPQDARARESAAVASPARGGRPPSARAPPEGAVPVQPETPRRSGRWPRPARPGAEQEAFASSRAPLVGVRSLCPSRRGRRRRGEQWGHEDDDVAAHDPPRLQRHPRTDADRAALRRRDPHPRRRRLATPASTSSTTPTSTADRARVRAPLRRRRSRSSPPSASRSSSSRRSASADGFWDFSKEHILESVDESLAALQLELPRHAAAAPPRRARRARRGRRARSTSCRRAGKVRNFGVSNHTPGQVELLKRSVQAAARRQPGAAQHHARQPHRRRASPPT